jgi:TP901 family phage tail tape measure protein
MANSAVVGILRALLTANTAEFEVAMKRSGEAAKAFSRETRTIGQQATQIGTALTKTLTLPIAGAGAAIAKFAIEFESSFAGVRKTVDASEAEFKVLEASLRGLAKEIPVNVNELNRLAEAAGALGIPKEEIVDFTRVMAMLGVTTNVTSDQAATSIAKIQNIFGAAGQQTEEFASTLVDLGNKGASTEQEIIGLAERIASAGHAAGISQGEVLGFSAAIANVGMDAEAGGTAMSRTFNDIARAVAQGGSELAKFARVADQSVTDFATLFKNDAAAATLAFVEGLGRIQEEGGNLIGTLDELGFKEIRQSDLLRRLALSGDNLSDSLKIQSAAWAENSALAEEARKRFDTVSGNLTLLWNRVKDVAITLGEALLPMIRATISALDSLIPLIEGMAEGFVALPVPVQATAVGLLAVAAAAGPLLIVIGQMSLAVSALTGAFAAKGLAARTAGSALAGLGASFPTVTAAAGALTAKLALSTTTVSGLSLVFGALGQAVAVAGAAFVGWKIGRWIGEATGLTDVVERLTGRIMGLTQAQIDAGMAARKHVEAVDALAVSLEALAARDLAKFAGASQEAAKRARELAENLPEAVKQSDRLADAVRRLSASGQLTPSVMSEVAKQSRGLAAAGVELPPVLANIVRSFEKIAEEAPPAGNGIGGVGSDAEDAAESIKKLNDALHDLDVRNFKRMQEDQENFSRTLEVGTDRVAKGIIDAGKKYFDALDKFRDNPDVKLVPEDLSLGLLERESNRFFEDLKKAPLTFRQEFREVVAGIPSMLASAFTGGGGIKGAISGIGTQMGALIGKNIFGGLDAAGKGISGLAKGMTGLGASVVSALGPVIGALAGPLLQKLMSIGGPSKEELAGRESIGQFEQKLSSMLTKTQRLEAGNQSWKMTVIAVRDAYLKAGLTAEQADAAVQRLWASSKKGAKETEAAIGAISAVIEESEEKLESLNGEFGNLLREAQALGVRLPEDLRGPIQSLIDMGRITGENADLFAALMGNTEVDFKKMSSLAQEFGIDVAGLGGSFQQARLNDRAKEIINAFDVLARGGADVNVVLDGMKDEISEVVQDSLKFGTTIPENMRPWIDQLFEAGELVDEDGEKIEDLSGLKFADPIVTEFQKIVLKLEELIGLLRGPLVDAIVNVPDVDVGVGVSPGSGSAPEPDATHGLRGGFVTASRGIVQSFGLAGGPVARRLQPTMQDSVPANLAPGEFVLDHQRLANVVSGLEAGAEISRNLALAQAPQSGAEVVQRLIAIEEAILRSKQTSVELDGREVVLGLTRVLENNGAPRTLFRESLGL